MADDARLNILVSVGTRPEAIKMVPVIRAIERSARFKPFVVSTGQHPGLVDGVLALGGIEAAVDLAIARPGGTLNELFASVLTRLERALLNRFGQPDSVLTTGGAAIYPVLALVHGDTTSAAAAALAAFHLRMPVAHVEAGLRTHTTYSPYPEELNRQLISRIASFHFAPTMGAEDNLLREGISYREVFVTGNTAIDAMLWSAELEAPFEDPALADLDDDPREVVVVTAHRRENWGEGIVNIGAAVATLAADYPNVRFVVALHPNPAVAGPLTAALTGFDNVNLVPPMGYAAFSHLLRRARFVISDSGGIQEEAPAVGTPVLVTRITTERGEGVTAGTVRIVGTVPGVIVAAARELLDNDETYLRMTNAENPFGDGHAAERIVKTIEHLAFGTEPAKEFGAEDYREVVLRGAGMSEGLIEAALAQEDRGAVAPPPELPVESLATRPIVIRDLMSP